MPPAMAAMVTKLPADSDDDPAMSEGGTVPGGKVPVVGAMLPVGPAVKSRSLDAVVGAELSPKSIAEEGAAVGTPVKPRSLDAEVGAAVWLVGVGAMVKEMSREATVGAMVSPGARGAMVMMGAAAGASV